MTVSEYVPNVDPLKLAAMTPAQIGRIGEATAHALEQAADEHMRAAEFIANDMRLLARWMREHSTTVNKEVIEFCSKSVTVVETLERLERVMRDEDPPVEQFLEQQSSHER